MTDESPDCPSAYLALASELQSPNFPGSVFSPKSVLLQAVSPPQHQAKRRVLIDHKRLKDSYVSLGVSYLRQRFLSHLVAIIHHPTISDFRMYQRLNYIATELILYELEIATWVSFAALLDAEDLKIDADELCLFLAYTAKKICCAVGEGEMWEVVCDREVPGFAGKYVLWRANTRCIQAISLSELNSLIAFLTQPVGSRPPVSIDYNDQVDSLFNDNKEKSH